MHKRGKGVENKIVARQMERFFSSLTGEKRDDYHGVAASYGAHMFNKWRRRLVQERKFVKAPFHVGVGMTDDDFAGITKRTVLVSDTLLLAHPKMNKEDASCYTGIAYSKREGNSPYFPDSSFSGDSLSDIDNPFPTWQTTRAVQMHCPDPSKLGRWLIDTEALLRAGLVWYLPRYSIDEYEQQLTHGYLSRPSDDLASHSGPTTNVPSLLHFMATNGRVVTRADTPPLKARVVIPVAEVSLPFLQGVNLRDFSEITVQELASAKAFRRFMQQNLLDIDEALNAVERDRELIRIGHEIEEGVRGLQDQLSTVRRRRSVSATGAVLGTVGATLTAVYGPAFQHAVTVLGVAGAGGVWTLIQTLSDNSTQSLHNSPWYYVWSLTRRSEHYDGG